MNDAASRRAEWERLRAERAALRASLAESLREVEARARDPFGLKEQVRRHPVLAAGLAAGAGAILVNLLMARRAPDAGRREEAGADPERDDAPSVFDTLRDAALRVATPWIARFVADRLGRRAEPAGSADPAEPSETNGSRS